MNYIQMKARAKINPALDVIGKREDGYHELKMIMQTVNVYDTLFIKKTLSNKIELSTNLVWLPNDGRNLVYKAAELLRSEYNIKNGLYINLNKSIPVAAGLAGGSSDCAAALIGIRNLFNLQIPNEKLYEYAKQLGADVPYCLLRGTALAEGIGEKLTKLNPFPKVFVLLAKPPISVSTASVFKSFDVNKVQKHPDIEKILFYIEKSDINGICSEMGNVLEDVTAKEYPIINELKNSMLENGALGSLMSGSGPTVFGFFETKSKAFNSMKVLKKDFHIKDCFITTIFNP